MTNSKEAFGSQGKSTDFVVIIFDNQKDFLETDQHHRGNLFTLFLHSPLMGMCLVSSACEVPMNLWEKCQALVDRFISEASRLVTRGRSVGKL